MKRAIRTTTFFVFGISLFLFSCDNIGLGNLANTRSPRIEMLERGLFLSGSENKIKFNVFQEFGIIDVFMRLEFLDTKGNWHEGESAYTMQGEHAGGNTWVFNIDTKALHMEDGRIILRVTAIDVSENVITTTNIEFIVKNELPQIELNIPVITSDMFSDPDLNIDLAAEPIFTFFPIVGVATDAMGIALGYPKMQMWPADFANVDAFDIPTTPDNYGWGAWHSLIVDRSNPTAVTFERPLVQLDLQGTEWVLPVTGGEDIQPGTYRFRIVVEDLDGARNYFPKYPNHFIQIEVITTDIPIIQIFGEITPYNGIGDFIVNSIAINAENHLDLSTVSAWITYGTGDAQQRFPASGGYSLEHLGTVGTRYTFRLVIPESETAFWPVPSDGRLQLHLHAVDLNDRGSPATSRWITYDISPPDVNIVSPHFVGSLRTPRVPLGGGGHLEILDVINPGDLRPNWVTGNVVVMGNADNAFPLLVGITRISYHVGSLGDDLAVTDAARATAINNFHGWTDTMLHTNTPSPGWNGNLRNFAFTSNFNDFEGLPAQILSNIQLGLPDSEDFITANLRRFFLPFYLRVENSAGNFIVINYKLAIDPDMDEPFVSFVNPSEGAVVGGTIRLSGNASQNEWVQSVIVRITKEDGNVYNPVGAAPFNFATANIQANDPNLALIPAAQRNGWYIAELRGQGQAVSWSINVNSAGGLNLPGPGGQQQINVQALALGRPAAPYRISLQEQLQFIVSNEVPGIGNPVIIKDGFPNRDFTDGILASGIFKMEIELEDTERINTVVLTINQNQYTIVANGDVQNVDIPMLTNWSLVPRDAAGRDERVLTLEFDSTDTATLPIFGFGRGGNLNVHLMVTNIRTPPVHSTASFNMAIDNFFPNMEIYTPVRASGDNFMLEGIARDHNPGVANNPQFIEGLERVLIFFEEAEIVNINGQRTVRGTGVFLDPDGEEIPSNAFVTGPVSAIDTINMAVGFNANAGMPNTHSFAYLPVLVDVGGVWTTPYAIIIDQSRGTWSGLLTRTFGARMDTMLFNDGPLMVHYIVMDEAGNIARFSDYIFIENNRPQIQSLNVGTVVDDTNPVIVTMANNITIGATTDGNQTIVFNPTFRVRNDRFDIRLNVTGGNRQNRYRISLVTPNVPTTTLQRGNVYTIAELGTTNWVFLGAPNNVVGTTFTATASTTVGSGSVTPYTTSWTRTGKLPAAAGGFSTLTLSATDFNGIQDSTGTDDRLFIVKIFDEAVPGADEAEQLAHAVILATTIQNDDTENPVISVAPFGQEYIMRGTGGTLAADPPDPIEFANYNRNIVMNNNNSGNTRLGFVQYAEHSLTANADISGRVIFRGKVTENQRIQRITAQIPGFNGGAAFDIAHWNNTNNVIESAGSTIAAVAGTANWGFEAEAQHLTLNWGHALVWAFAWNTEAITGAAQNNVTITFRVYDHAGNNSASTITVNVVPFITEVVTRLSRAMSANPSAFNRSALGWFPVGENEVITVRGFNFGATPTVLLNNTTLASEGNSIVGAFSEARRNIGTAAVSGELTVRANNVDSVNNRTNVQLINPSGPNNVYSNRIAPYNWEPNNLNNNILTVRREIYVWTRGSILNRPEANIRSPVMRMNPQGGRFMSYSTGLPSHLRVRVDNTETAIQGSPTNWFINTTIAIDSANDWYIGSSNLSAGLAGNARTFSFSARVAATGAWDNNLNGTNRRRIVGLSNPFNTSGFVNVDRVQIPRIFAQNTNNSNRGTNNNVTRIFISYFDDSAEFHLGDTNNPRGGQSVIFHYGLVGANLTADANSGGDFGNTGQGEVLEDGTTVTTHTTINSDGVVVTQGPNQYGHFAFRQVVANNSTTHSGSIFTAVGALSNGLPVIAWYDAINDNLVFSFGSGVPTTDTLAGGQDGARTSFVRTTTEEWQSNAVIVARGRGSHVDMVVDSNDNIHLAFYNISGGGLYYAFIPHNGLTGADRRPTRNENLIQVRGIDTFLAAGTRLMLNVRWETRNVGGSGVELYVPYISYFHNSFRGTANSIRVAWPVEFDAIAGNHVARAGTHLDTTFTGGWEVMTVPTSVTDGNVGRVPVSAEFVSNGVPRNSTQWVEPTDLVTVGGTAGTAGTPLTRRGTELGRSIVLGFMTTDWYEGAILKHNIW